MPRAVRERSCRAGGPTPYDRIGSGYPRTRQADPAHERAIVRALGDARSVVNVGAGTGPYEPRDRRVVAVEPSGVMIAQRPAGTAPVVQARAERLPFEDARFDAALAILTVHHWAEIAELDRDRFPPPERIVDILGGGQILSRLTPANCADGFTPVFWRRPHAYLDPGVRVGMSTFASLDEELVKNALARLARDESGRWHSRNAELLELDEYDAGHRLIVAEMCCPNGGRDRRSADERGGAPAEKLPGCC
jgi:hypothetical protein